MMMKDPYKTDPSYFLLPEGDYDYIMGRAEKEYAMRRIAIHTTFAQLAVAITSKKQEEIYKHELNNSEVQFLALDMPKNDMPDGILACEMWIPKASIINVQFQDYSELALRPRDMKVVQ